MTFVMKDEGIREVKLLQSLTLRNRTEIGRDVFDGELENWSECLHRYDNFPKEEIYKSQYDVITGAVNSMYKDGSMNYKKLKMFNKTTIHQTLGSRAKLLITDMESRPPQVWNGKESNEFLKMGPSKKSTSHFDYSTCITAHPKLPLYVTGNNKGKLCVWPFNNLADTTVGNEYYTYHQKNNTSSKKLTIEKCMFSNYGDKLAALNSDGTFFMFNFDMEASHIYPFVKQKSERDLKMRDFDFLNRDTVIAEVSKRQYALTIYDLLLPDNRNVIHSTREMGGTKLCTLLRRQQILSFNSHKNGAMKIFDIRQNKIMDTIQLVNDEITTVALSKDQQTLITGGKDGVVKIWDIKHEFVLRESIDAFIDPATHKKHEVS